MLNKKEVIFLIISIISLLLIIHVVSGELTPGTINSCGKINSSGEYNLSANLNGTNFTSTGCIEINISNVYLDCENFEISNTSLTVPAILLNGSAQQLSNITISQCVLSMPNQSEGSKGIWAINAINLIFRDNIIRSTYYGIIFNTSSNNSIFIGSNYINYSYYGLLIDGVGNHSFANISINNSKRDAIRITAEQPQRFYNNFTNISATNTNSSHFDLHFTIGGSEKTYLVDNPLLTTYNFAGNNSPGTKLIFRDIGEGKVEFLSFVNGSGINLTNDVNIKTNLITIPSGSNFTNKSANMTLYNIRTNFITGTVFKDHGQCLNSSVSKEYCHTYSANNAATVIFNISEGGAGFSIGESLNLTFCAKLDRSNSTYNLTTNIIPRAGCINITAPNIVLNCKNFGLNNVSLPEQAISVNASNTTVKNCNITTQANGTLSIGIYVFNATNVTLSNNTIGNSFRGILLNLSANNSYIINNKLNRTAYGLSIESSSYNIIENLSIQNTTINSLQILIGTSATAGLNASYNNFTNVTILYPNATGYDLKVVANVTDRNYIIDSVIHNYSFGVSGNNGSLLAFKDTGEGMIEYLKPVNGTGTYLSKDLNISNELIFVNSTRARGLNNTAKLTLFGVDYGNPKPQFDLNLSDSTAYADCTTETRPVCTEINYSTASQIYVFNTTHFTAFRSVEGYPGDSNTGNGGGSSGSGIYNPTSDLPVAYVIDKLEAGEEWSKTIPDFTITSFNIKVVQAAEGVEVAFKQVLKRPEEIPQVLKSVFKYIRAEIGGTTEENIREVILNFKVEKSWITENNIDPSTIILERYAYEKWHQLPTIHLNSDDTYEYYTAKTPGFSYFAITGEPFIVVSEEGEKIVAPPVDNTTRAIHSAILIIAGLTIVVLIYSEAKQNKGKKKK